MSNGSDQEFPSRVKPQPQDQEKEQTAALPNSGEDFAGFSRTGELPGTISLSFIWLILIAALSFIAGLIAANGFGHSLWVRCPEACFGFDAGGTTAVSSVDSPSASSGP